MKPILFTVMLFCICRQACGTTIDIAVAGAKSGGTVENSAVIQKAVDSCAGKGDTVLVPEGTFLTKPISMKSKVTLYLAKGAVLLGTPYKADYLGAPETDGDVKGLIHGYDLQDIAVTGEGLINGNGAAQDFQTGNSSPGRPRVLQFVRCRNVKVADVGLRDAAFWTAYFKACVTVRINHVGIRSVVNFNNDGFDIDSKDVILADCTVETDDDAICLKSDVKGLLCENIVVRRCTVATACNAIKFGTAGYAGFRNVDIRDVVIRPPANFNTMRNRQTALAGIAIESVDGGLVDSVNISDVYMQGIMTPIFIKLGDRNTPVGSLKNVTISRLTAFPDSKICANITGLPAASDGTIGFNVENVTLSDILIHLSGLGTVADASIVVPEKNSGYPEILMFGVDAFPVYGLFVRHVQNLTLKNVQFNLLAPDARAAFRFEDLQGLDTSGVRLTALPLSSFPSGLIGPRPRNNKDRRFRDNVETDRSKGPEGRELGKDLQGRIMERAVGGWRWMAPVPMAF